MLSVHTISCAISNIGTLQTSFYYKKFSFTRIIFNFYLKFYLYKPFESKLNKQ